MKPYPTDEIIRQESNKLKGIANGGQEPEAKLIALRLAIISLQTAELNLKEEITERRANANHAIAVPSRKTPTANGAAEPNTKASSGRNQRDPGRNTHDHHRPANQPEQYRLR